MSRREINQLIDDAGKVLEETSQRPLVKRDFQDGLIYKTREPSPHPGESDHDRAWNDWAETVIANEFDRGMVPAIAKAAAEQIDALELRLDALAADIEALRGEIVALR